MKYLSVRPILVYFYCFCLTTLNGQYQTIDFNLTISSYIDGNVDNEYLYESTRASGLVTATAGYSKQISKKFAVTPIIGVSTSFQEYVKLQQNSGSILDRTFIKKTKRNNYLTTGGRIQYWAFKHGHGISVKSELFVHMLLNSNIEIQEKFEKELSEFENGSESDALKKLIPVLSIGPEFSLRVSKRIAFNIGIAINFRPYGYYKNSVNTSYLNKEAQMGFKIILGG